MVATFVMFAVNEQGELMSSSLSETRLLLYVDEQFAMSLHLYCSNIYIYKYIIYIYIYYRNYKKLKFSRDGDPYYFSRNFHNIETI